MNVLQKMRLIAAILLAGLLLSCSNASDVLSEDSNPLSAQIEGMWWGLIDSTGTYVSGKDTLEYTRIGHALQFGKDGSGYAVTLFFNDESGEPINLMGGKNFAQLTYKSSSNGEIKASFDKAYSYYADFYKAWNLEYADSCISVNDGKSRFYLKRVDETMAALIQEWDQTANGGAAADNYNINEVDFTQSNWRNQEAIYIYDGIGMDATDAKKRSGYTLVNMPWYEGPKSVNLPEGFTDDITPENGWEWVMNLCGNRSSTNNNFFAVYNKYTGILRFFYYMPNNYNTGNDHVWQVSMTDQLAQSSTIRYGLPFDRKIVDKAAIDQVGKGTIVEYISPWVDYLTPDGLIMPNVGWWAFDVDLSVYRNINTSSSENIRLQMRTWNVEHVSLSSTLAANIDGSIKANIDLLKSQHINNSVMGYLGMLGSMGGSMYGAISKLKEGKAGEAFSSIIDFGKTTANLFGIKTEDAQDINGTMDGTINLAMTGNINTEGFIKYAKAAVGVAAPTMQWKDFRSNGSHIGEGIWNIESAPVVYYTDGYVDWKTEDKWTTSTWYDNELPPYTGEYQHYRKYTRHLSPFGGMMPNMSTSKHPHYGHIAFFDPSSIKLKLNPNVFTSEEIKSAKVYAICGVRKGVKYGSTDGYRKAQGLSGSGFSVENTYQFINRPYTEAPFDALSGRKDKMGLQSAKTFAAEGYNGVSYGLFGRGDNDYLIEPQYLSNGSGTNTMPPYEVTVSVVVTHEGKPIVYSRTYLPEYKFMSLANMENEVSRIKNGKPAEYDADMYGEQVAHLSDVLKWVQRTPHPIIGTPFASNIIYATTGDDGWHWAKIFRKQDDENGSFANLFDGNTNTEWITCDKDAWRYYSGGRSVANDSYVWFAEFETHFPVTPKSWTLWNAVNGDIGPRNPSHAALYGKRNQNDNWVMLDNEHPYAPMPTVHGSNTFGFNIQKPQDMKYFRLEVFGNQGDPVLGLSELIFNYED